MNSPIDNATANLHLPSTQPAATALLYDQRALCRASSHKGAGGAEKLVAGALQQPAQIKTKRSLRRHRPIEKRKF